ncbi:histone-lysine N-methyltransferase trithorax isoform X3 [Cloeon dipterum]|uniref:histone-lysine N-methyltransferase trithorax isoform X2 n=1 Tax=Cloeon dipterum TaxID=197152 RepID=UPI00322066D3
MTRYRFPGRTCKNSSSRKRVRGYWSVTDEALEAEQIYKNLVAWRALVGASDDEDEDFLGFTSQDEQQARSTAVIEAHSLEKETAATATPKTDDGRVTKPKRPASVEPCKAKIETELPKAAAAAKSEPQKKESGGGGKKWARGKHVEPASTTPTTTTTGKSSILKPSLLKFESFSSGHTLGANWTLKPSRPCVVCEGAAGGDEEGAQCDACRRFVERMSQHSGQKLMCHRGRAVCRISGVEVRARCPACWLMICLAKLPVPHKTLARLRKCLPSSLQHQVGPGNPVKKDPLRGWSDNVLNQTQMAARALMKKAAKTANNSKIKETSKKQQQQLQPVETEKPKRQKSHVKGPRIKHVCRRACVVLGQPQATFPGAPTLDIFKKYAASEAKHKEKKAAPKTMVEVPQEKAAPAAASAASPAASTLPPELLGLPAAAPTKAEPPAGWICVDFEATEATGVPVMSAVGTSNLPPALCVLCGSAGKEELLFCAMCCEPYHIFCLKTNPQLNKMWVCERCELCGSCEKPTMNHLDLARCQKCALPFHKACLAEKPAAGRPWECPACNICRSCGLAVPNMKSAGNASFCPPCYKLRLKGNFCPHCQQCYKDDDYDTKMVECAECLSWVHASCEGISDEKYQILSILPESIEFHCKNCTPEVPPLWSQAVDNEMRNGIMNVVTSLAKQQSVKLSPNKRVNLEAEQQKEKEKEKEIEKETEPQVQKAKEAKQEDKTDAEPAPPALQPKEEKKDEPKIKVKDEKELMPVEQIKREPQVEAAKMKLDFEEGNLPQLVVRLTDCVKQKAKATQTLKLKQIREAYNIKECSVHLRKCALPAESKPPPPTTTPPPMEVAVPQTPPQPDKNANYDATPSKMSTPPKAEPSTSAIAEEEEKEKKVFIELDDENAATGHSKPSETKKAEIDVKALSLVLRKASLGTYDSLAAFDAELRHEVLRQKHDSVLDTYAQLLAENFPWFKAGTVEPESKTAKTPTDKAKPPADGKGEKKSLSQLYTAAFKDNRVCALCHGCGDASGGEGGERLLHTGSAPPLDWVHANCALWSSEVYEDRAGVLHCVAPPGGALSRAPRTRCAECGERGATVGCCHGAACHNSYHWPCVLAQLKLGRPIFLDHAEMALYCAEHGQQRRMLAELDDSLDDSFDDELDFPLPRKLKVEPARSKKRYADPVCVQMTIGSLRVERLGVISSSVCHDETRDVLVPHGFVAKRLFWSTKEPWKIVEYVIVTELEVETTVDEALARDINLTVEHGAHGAPAEVMEKNLRVLRHIQQQELIDLSRDNELNGKDNADDLLLPPDLKETIFQDLNNELLEGISMQDIFTKLLADDLSKEEASDGEENPIREVVDLLLDQVEHEVRSRKRPRPFGCGADDELAAKMMRPAPRLSQLDGADDSSSDSEESSKPDDAEVNVEVETSLRGVGDSDEGPVKCKSCKRTYRTKASYDKHLPSCTEVSSESSDESSESPTTSRVSAKTAKFGTVVVKTKLVVMQSPDKNQKRKRESRAVRRAVKLAAKPSDSQPPPQHQQQHVHHQHHSMQHQVQYQQPSVSEKTNFAPQLYHHQEATPQIVLGQNAAPIYMAPPTVYYINVAPPPPPQPAKQNFLLVNGPDGQQNLVCVPSAEPEPTSSIILPQAYGNVVYTAGGGAAFVTQAPLMQNHMTFLDQQPQLVNTPNGLFLTNASSLGLGHSHAPFVLPSMGLGQHQHQHQHHELKDPFMAPSFTPDLQIKQEPSPALQLMSPTPPLLSLSQLAAPQPPPQPLSAPPPPQAYYQRPLLPPPPAVLPPLAAYRRPPLVQRPPPAQIKTATRSYVEAPPPVKAAATAVSAAATPPSKQPLLPAPAQPPPPRTALQEKQICETMVVKITASASVGTQTSRCQTPSAVSVKKEAEPDDKTGIRFKIQSADGFVTTAHNVSQAWHNIFEAVQTARKAFNLTPLPYNPFSLSGQQMTGLGQDPVKFLIEQLPGVVKCPEYTLKLHNVSKKKAKKLAATEPKLNLSGCVRTEPYKGRHPYDMFGWLASEHRKPPTMPADDFEQPIRSKSSSNLPMAMRFRQLKNNARVKVGVFRSLIHGRGLFCIRELEPTEMVIEYAGEVIRSIHTDRREKIYESKEIGCYMFRIDDDTVVDATMKGNAARFINHSCEPNCYSKVVDVLGKKHILIFALRRIVPGEELTYDYKFPFEEDKIPCTCGSRRCRKYLN